jgi:Uma2 family endonuclease
VSLPESKLYTYADYLEWPDDKRIEIIYGVAHMQATPTPRHQEILMELGRQFANYLASTKNCKIYPSPFTVRIANDLIFEPDLTIICDKSKVDNRGCTGAPDMIIEILSPSSIKHDRYTKFREYEKAGVKEYWIVEPEGKIVSVFILDDKGKYNNFNVYGDDDEGINVGLFRDLEIDLGLVFGEEI